MVILLGVMAITGFLSAFVRLGARIGAGARCLDFIRHPEDPQAGKDSGQARPHVGQAAYDQALRRPSERLSFDKVELIYAQPPEVTVTATLRAWTSIRSL